MVSLFQYFLDFIQQAFSCAKSTTNDMPVFLVPKPMTSFVMPHCTVILEQIFQSDMRAGIIGCVL